MFYRQDAQDKQEMAEKEQVAQPLSLFHPVNPANPVKMFFSKSRVRPACTFGALPYSIHQVIAVLTSDI